MAVHYAHRGMLPAAVKAMQAAIQLRPKDVKYRNNIATALIQLGRPQEAFEHLCTVHDEASAHYDLGFLMMKIKQPQAAALQFSLALRINPSLVQARQWLDRLHGRSSAPPPALTGTAGPRSASPPPAGGRRHSAVAGSIGTDADAGQRCPRAGILAATPARGAIHRAAAGGVLVGSDRGGSASQRCAAGAAAAAANRGCPPPPPLPPASNAPATTPALPRFPNPLRDAPPRQDAPMPPDTPHAAN